jgi:RNA polymerase primary sigma factor
MHLGSGAGSASAVEFMASKPKVTPQKEEMLEKEGPETPPDSPLLDRSNGSVKALIRAAKRRGYVTHDQINSLMKEVNSEQIENVLAMFSEMGHQRRRGSRDRGGLRRGARGT